MRHAALICTLLLTFAAAFPVLAEDAAPAPDAAQDESPAEAKDEAPAPVAQGKSPENKAPEPSPGMKDLQKSIGKMTMDMDGLQRRHFFMIYNNNNIISAVKTVRTDVKNAVAACGKNNPDLQKPLDLRFADWESTVSGLLEKAEANRDGLIAAQDYAKPEAIRAINKKADELREETQMKIEKTPVTTKEACDYLLNKMTETQDALSNLLRQTLITFPQALQNDPTYLEEEADKVEKKDDAEPAAESDPAVEPGEKATDSE